MGDAIPELGVLGSIRKKAGKVMRSKAVSSPPLRLLQQPQPLGSYPFEFLLSLLSDNELLYGAMNEISPFLPKSRLVTVFHHRNSDTN